MKIHVVSNLPFSTRREAVRIFAGAVLLAFLGSSAALAGPEKANKETKPAAAQPIPAVAPKPAAKPAPPQKTLVTGSRIPQAVKRNGLLTDSANAVIVIDRQELARSGATTVADVLRRLPIR